ncbi:MAG: hypothetical protein GMKNLPBB_00791 [Myxococcota bacterium]|nr:hypothetical protein [Myxococcota bacterium]
MNLFKQAATAGAIVAIVAACGSDSVTPTTPDAGVAKSKATLRIVPNPPQMIADGKSRTRIRILGEDASGATLGTDINDIVSCYTDRSHFIIEGNPDVEAGAGEEGKPYYVRIKYNSTATGTKDRSVELVTLADLPANAKSLDIDIECHSNYNITAVAKVKILPDPTKAPPAGGGGGGTGTFDPSKKDQGKEGALLNLNFSQSGIQCNNPNSALVYQIPANGNVTKAEWTGGPLIQPVDSGQVNGPTMAVGIQSGNGNLFILAVKSEKPIDQYQENESIDVSGDINSGMKISANYNHGKVRGSVTFNRFKVRPSGRRTGPQIIPESFLATWVYDAYELSTTGGKDNYVATYAGCFNYNDPAPPDPGDGG